MNRLGSLVGNDFVAQTQLARFHDKIAQADPEQAEEDAEESKQNIVADVVDFMAEECRTGKLRPSNVSEWLNHTPLLSLKVKEAVRKSLDQYRLVPRKQLLIQKGGQYAALLMQKWEHGACTPEKLLVQIVCDHVLYESPCLEVGMAVSVWEMTAAMRHNIYALLMAPIRHEHPVITELSISPLERGCTPGMQPVQVEPTYEFVEEHGLEVTPEKPIVMFVTHKLQSLRFKVTRMLRNTTHRMDKAKAAEVLFDACGLERNKHTCEALMLLRGAATTGNYQLGMIACVTMVANIVAKYRALPSYCHKALVYQMFLTGTKERFRNVRLEMSHINATAAYQRVYSYFKSLNMACSCPIKVLQRSGFINGKVFHMVCNLFCHGNEKELRDHFQTAGRLGMLEKAHHICQTALDLHDNEEPEAILQAVEQEQPQAQMSAAEEDALATRVDLRSKCIVIVTKTLALSVGCRADGTTDVGVHLLGDCLHGAPGEQEQAAAGNEYAAESCVLWFGSDANEVGQWAGSTVVSPCCYIGPQQLEGAALEHVVACAPHSGSEVRTQLQKLLALAAHSKQDAASFVKQRFADWLKRSQSTA